MIPLQTIARGVIFLIRVVPRASRSELAGIQGDALKLRITAPPVDGKANEECIRLVAELIEVRRAQVQIVGGQTARTKTIAVTGKDPAEISARLERLLSCRQKDLFDV